MKKNILILGLTFVFLLAAGHLAHATLDQAVATTGEGAVGLPVSLLKLVGGLVWTIGEVLIFPFKVLFG